MKRMKFYLILAILAFSWHLINAENKEGLNKSYVADEHTVLLFHFDDKEPCLKDSSKSHNDGIFLAENIPLVDGEHGKAMEFNGGDKDYIKIKHSESLCIAEELTIEIIMKYYKGAYIVQKGRCFGLGFDEKGRIGGSVWVDGKWRTVTDRDQTRIFPDEWFNVALTYSLKDKKLKLYINGKERGVNDLAKDNLSTYKINTDTHLFAIGTDSMRWGTPMFEGVIDEIRISNICRNFEKQVVVKKTVQSKPRSEKNIPATNLKKVEPIIEVKEKVVSLRNTFIDMELSAVSGVEITKFINKYLGKRNCLGKPGPLFSLYCAGRKIPNENYRVNEILIEQTDEVKTVVLKMTAENAGKPENVLKLELRISISDEPDTRWNLRLIDSPGIENVLVNFPEIKHLSLSDDIDEDYYLLPSHALLIGNKFGEGDYEFGTLSGADNGLLTEWVDVFNKDAGIYLRIDGEHDVFKTFRLGKRDNSIGGEAGIRIVVSYIERDLPKGSNFQPMDAVIGVHPGDWRTGFEKQRDYLQKKFPPHRPQASWADRVWSSIGFHPESFLDKDGYKLKEIADLADYLDYCELWGWWFEFEGGENFGSGPSQAHARDKVIDFVKTEYGRYNSVMGGIKTFKQYLDAWKKYGKHIGLYMGIQMSGWNNANKGHTYKNQSWESWCVRRQPGGEPYKNFNSYIMCLSAKGWQDFLAHSCARVLKDTDCDIIRLDTMGTHSIKCRNTDHEHNTYNNWTSADMWFDAQVQLVSKVRDAMDKVKTDYMLTGESPGTPRLIREISGSLSYGVDRGRGRGEKAPVDTCRFLFPYTKLWAYPHRYSKPKGKSFINHALFNGMGFALDLPKPADQEFIPVWKHARDFLDENRDAFNSKKPVPLLPTLQTGLYANYFPAEAKKIYMLLNTGSNAVQGNLLNVTTSGSTHFVDLFNHKNVKIEGGNIVSAESFPPSSIMAIAELPRLIAAKLDGEIMEINVPKNIINPQLRLLKITGNDIVVSTVESSELPGVKIRDHFDEIDGSARLAIQLLENDLLLDEWVVPGRF